MPKVGFLRQSGVNAESPGNLAEPFVFCPQQGGRTEEDGGYQVCVGQTDA